MQGAAGRARGAERGRGVYLDIYPGSPHTSCRGGRSPLFGSDVRKKVGKCTHNTDKLNLI
jgi:hypothetical protein